MTTVHYPSINIKHYEHDCPCFKSTIIHQLSTINQYQPLIIITENCPCFNQPSIMNRQPSIINQPSISINHHPSILNPSTINHQSSLALTSSGNHSAPKFSFPSLPRLLVAGTGSVALAWVRARRASNSEDYDARRSRGANQHWMVPLKGG